MKRSLSHHGIKGMKWGIRRTPEQLGHVEGKAIVKRKRADDPKEMSIDELREKNARLSEEERYRDFLARRKAAATGETKKALKRAIERLRDRSLDWLVDRAFDKITKSEKKDSFDINDYKDVDVNDMSPEIISIVARWYENAAKVEKERQKRGGSGTS